ncbi:EF-hand domain-containing protein [Paludisphaera mucosa]|uniref:EF-hand domain-containing protein n=1 Tax=Paludisphaera mucosa TaxID=3030827 RepID=A0ABT6F6B3_9BACT|nr:hypothetical protein [Paludisphaera mucosa]MDG3003041.1 hypothetical protein [Paludisphaera mucosa]
MRSRCANLAGLGMALGLTLVGPTFGDEPKTGAGKRLAGLFADLDVDNDGVLDKGEVAASAKPAFQKILAKGDANDDGKIDSKEFDALAEKVVAARKGEAKTKGVKAAKADAKAGDVAVGASAKGAAKGGERLKGLAERFKTQDADKDGRLSRDEFQGKPAAFERLDADHNGYLDKADLKALRGRRKSAKPDASN